MDPKVKDWQDQKIRDPTYLLLNGISFLTLPLLPATASPASWLAFYSKGSSQCPWKHSLCVLSSYCIWAQCNLPRPPCRGRRTPTSLNPDAHSVLSSWSPEGQHRSLPPRSPPCRVAPSPLLKPLLLECSPNSRLWTGLCSLFSTQPCFYLRSSPSTDMLASPRLTH